MKTLLSTLMIAALGAGAGLELSIGIPKGPPVVTVAKR